MEARSFFENSPMAEITVTATKEEWVDLLIDLDWLAQELDEREYEDGIFAKLEAGSLALIESLAIYVLLISLIIFFVKPFGG